MASTAKATKARTPSRRKGKSSSAGAARGSGPVQSLSRALALLEALAEADAGMLLTELAQQVGLAPSTTHRLLSTLHQNRYVDVDEERGLWFIGVQAFTVGNAFLANRDFVSIARPFMRRLMEQSGESVNLAILDDGEAVFLSQVECREMMRMLARLGSRVPMHASAVGKALLAALPRSEIDAILTQRGLDRYTANTILTTTDLRRSLEKIRNAGYAIDDEEHAVGLRCAAATIHDEHGEPVAAISLSGPRARIPGERVEALGRLVVSTTTEITAAMGGQLPGWRAC